MAQDEPDWRQFERAVADFVSALAAHDPSAKVTHDAVIPDADTGEPRQRDVWVEAKLLQHYPIKVLISCKRHARKLNQQNIDAFVGELQSSGAHMGVVYSYTGFSEAAIKKAKAKGICCCRLYQNGPPDLPEALPFQTYCCNPRLTIALLDDPPDPAWSVATWQDLFAIEIDTPNGTKSVLDAMDATIQDGQAKALAHEGADHPFPFDCKTTFQIDEVGRKPILIQMDLRWNYFRGKVEAQLLNGSYSVTDGQFKGSQLGPIISLRGPTPGPGWELLEGRPSVEKPGVLTAILSHNSFRESLVQTLGHVHFKQV